MQAWSPLILFAGLLIGALLLVLVRRSLERAPDRTGSLIRSEQHGLDNDYRRFLGYQENLRWNDSFRLLREAQLAQILRFDTHGSIESMRSFIYLLFLSLAAILLVVPALTFHRFDLYFHFYFYFSVFLSILLILLWTRPVPKRYRLYWLLTLSIAVSYFMNTIYNIFTTELSLGSSYRTAAYVIIATIIACIMVKLSGTFASQLNSDQEQSGHTHTEGPD
jgi:hypothetical protein